MLFVGTQCATEGIRSLKPRGRIMHTVKLFCVAQKSTDLVHPAFYWGLVYQPVNLLPPRGRLAGRDCTRTATRATYQVTQCALFALLKKFNEEKEILESRALLLSGCFDPPRVPLYVGSAVALGLPGNSYGSAAAM